MEWCGSARGATATTACAHGTDRPTRSTNPDYDEWHGFLGNKPLVEALLGRVRERCHTVKIDGPSLRAQQG